jgi:hypothetical protein
MGNVGKYLIEKPRNAGIIAFLFALLPLVYFPGGFVSGIIVALVTLARGAKAGVIVLAWVALPAISLLCLQRVGQYDILLLSAVFAWASAIYLRRVKSWQALVELLALVGVVFVVGVHVFVPNIKAWWVSHLRELMMQLNQIYNFQLPDDRLAQIAIRFSAMETGVATLKFLLEVLLLVALGRFWQLSLGKRKTLSEEVGHIRFGILATLLLLAAFLGVILKSPLIMDIFPLILLPYIVSALIMMHMYAKKNRGILVLLIATYVGLFLLPILSVAA